MSYIYQVVNAGIFHEKNIIDKICDNFVREVIGVLHGIFQEGMFAY